MSYISQPHEYAFFLFQLEKGDGEKEKNNTECIQGENKLSHNMQYKTEYRIQ